VIKAVIFDCFGVLTTDGWKQIREEFFARDEKLFRHSLDIDRAVNAGMMDYQEFIKEISGMTGLSVVDVRERLNGSAPNKMLFDFIRDDLKGKYGIGMLSNAADNWLDELFEPWQVELFDARVLSYEVGAVKPDPLIYEMILERLNITPEESIFVDDSERYCVAAETLGIKAIYHQDTNATIQKIKELTSA
jgi:HAD superfamily hydrolase (TIGR01509 family)